MNCGMVRRRATREVAVGDVKIGGNNKIAVQSMLSARDGDFETAKEQIRILIEEGCDIVRFAVLNYDTVKFIGEMKNLAEKNAAYKIPLVADIHYNYKLAIESAAAGIDKIRINPGNIGDVKKSQAVAAMCIEKKIPIRIGVNGGSLESHILKKYGGPTAHALAESAEYNVKLLEDFGMEDIVISVKSSNVGIAVAANRMIAEKFRYPIHIGATEAGAYGMGSMKNAAEVGALLLGGIGDTIRVSLTASPEYEVRCGIMILKALGLHTKGIEIISCPTCGRCKNDVMSIAGRLEGEIYKLERRMSDGQKIKAAVMGCTVNGPGEACDADFGIAGLGGGKFIFFEGGARKDTVHADDAAEFVLRKIEERIDSMESICKNL